MVRIAFCFLLLGVLANAHHGGSHDEDDHHHENSVDATLSPQGVLTVLFHGKHLDQEHINGSIILASFLVYTKIFNSVATSFIV